MRTRPVLLTLAIAGVLAGCPDADDPPIEPPADVPDVTIDDAPPVELPALTLDCSSCHSDDSLSKSPEGAAAGPRDWVALHSQGLIRRAPAIPTAAADLELPWPERGSHGPADLVSCDGCHPVRDDGVGHGVRTYPAAAAVFAAGAGCAPACHTWLQADVVVEGYAQADGARPGYEGSLRPQDLLEDVATAHTALWQQGARPDPQQTRITSFNAGCGGCHNIAAEAHGTIATCLDCHRFGGPAGARHQLHVSLVVDRAAALDPAGAAAGVSFCAYCHAEDAAPTESSSRSRRGCYGCHLSGHQPLDATGQAHFWPATPPD